MTPPAEVGEWGERGRGRGMSQVREHRRARGEFRVLVRSAVLDAASARLMRRAWLVWLMRMWWLRRRW